LGGGLSTLLENQVTSIPKVFQEASDLLSGHMGRGKLPNVDESGFNGREKRVFQFQIEIVIGDLHLFNQIFFSIKRIPNLTCSLLGCQIGN